jgi:hypothetical protein
VSAGTPVHQLGCQIDPALIQGKRGGIREERRVARIPVKEPDKTLKSGTGSVLFHHRYVTP